MSLAAITEFLKKASTSWGPILTTDQQENAFVDGKVFSYEDYKTYAESEVANFVFDPTKFAGTNLVILPPSFSATAGPVTVEYFAGTVADDDGTLLGISNRRGTSQNVNKAILRLNPSNITDGARFSGRLVPSNATNPVNLVGAEASGRIPFELVTTVKYLIRITNTNGADTLIQTDFTWMEL